jgi:4'-phosphopantetheinyl transferase
MNLPVLFQPAPVLFPTLQPGEVHVWYARFDQLPGALKRWESLFAEEEIRRATSFRFPADRERFVAGRALLRMLLGRYLEQPEDVRLRAGPAGKPKLDTGNPPPLEFNLSHSKTLVLYAFALDRRVGIDVEDLHPVLQAEDILRVYFPPADQEAFAAMPASSRDEMFLELWTKREACLKGGGQGLAGLEKKQAQAFPADGWQLILLRPAAGRVAALAYEGEIGKLSAWEIPGDLTRVG